MDEAEHLAELREQGWGEDELAIEREELERLRAPARVWPDNWTIVNVFLNCQWTLLVGMDGGHYQGISSTEVESVCRLLRVPRAERETVLRGVRLMAGAAAAILNERTSRG